MNNPATKNNNGNNYGESKPGDSGTLSEEFIRALNGTSVNNGHRTDNIISKKGVASSKSKSS